MELGFVGLGKMGRPMTEHLIEAGHRVHVHNRSRVVVDELAARGAVPATTPGEIASRAEMVMTCLTNTASVEEVYFGRHGLYSAAGAGQIFADHSTVGLDTSRRCADEARARGADFLDAPVSGGPAGAAGATLTIMVGGDQATFDRALPVFQTLGKNIRLCGPTGAGSAIKLVNQLLVAINTAGVAEALVFGLKAGADPQMILEVVGTGFGGSRMLERNAPLAMDRAFRAGTPINLLLKDLGLIGDLAGQLGARLEIGKCAEQIFAAARDAGIGDDDISGLVQPYERAAGAEVRRS